MRKTSRNKLQANERDNSSNENIEIWKGTGNPTPDRLIKQNSKDTSFHDSDIADEFEYQFDPSYPI